jgi:hypothetical protein
MTENAGQETESSLSSRPTTEGQPEQPTSAEGRIERLAAQTKDAVGFVGKEMAHELKKPTTGAAIAGAVVVGAAVTLGALETALGAATAYVTFRILKAMRSKEGEPHREG